MKRYILFAIALLLAALACATPPTTPTGTPEPPTGTLTPTGTENPAETPTATHTATVGPSATPTGFLTPTPIVPGDIPEDAPELLLNPGAEGIYHQCVTEDCPPFTIYDCPSGNCASFWIDYFCNDTSLDPNGFRYAPQKCDVPLVCQPGQTTGCNQPGEMATFESKEAATWVDPYRVYEGDRAIQQFCHGRNCWGGVYQVVDTTGMAYCEARGMVQGWFAATWRSNAEGNPPYRSDIRSADDRRNGHAQIVVYLDGGPPRFFDEAGNQYPLDRQVDNPNMLVSSDYGYEAGLYDITQPFAEMRFWFEPTGDQTTVSWEWYNLWPGEENEIYFDNLSVRCAPISGGAQDVIAPQSLESRSMEMFDWNNLVALLSQFALIAVALVVLALGNERIIELVQWVLSWFGAEVDGEKLKTVFSALVGLIMAAVAGLGLDGPLQELLNSLTPGFADMINWIAAFIALLSGMGLIEWFTNMWHDLFKASNLTTKTRGKASAARP